MEVEQEIKEIKREINYLMIWIGICFFSIIVLSYCIIKINLT